MLDLGSLQTSFKGDLCTPDHPDYEQAIVRWANNAQKRAQVVAFVKDAPDVALAIAYARENKLQIAIRGGAHSTAGASSSEGLVIDLSRYMRTVTVDAEKRLAYVGGGAVWGDVDSATIPHGLATAAGTVNHTGVGGLTLGGGIGWLSSEHGLVIDNLVQVTVVNSKGGISTASESENPDLFFGIRGGGCNFGVVTQFVFKLYPQRPTVYAGTVVYPFEALDQLIEVTLTWMESANNKAGMHQILAKAPHGPPAPAIVATFVYNGSEEEGRDAFKKFFEIKHLVDQTKERPYEELNGMLNHIVEYGKGRLIKGSYFIKPDVSSIKEAMERIVTLSDDEHSPVLILEYYHFEKILSVPNGTCAFIRSDAKNVTSITTWNTNTPENLAKARKMATELTDILAAGQKAHFKSNRGYGNYDMDGSPEVDRAKLSSKAEFLFAEHYPRLQKLKAEHDPDNVFSSWFPITPSA